MSTGTLPRISEWIEKFYSDEAFEELCAQAFPPKAPKAAAVKTPLKQPPPLTDKERIKERALIEVNAIRTEYDKPALSELPKGRRKDARNCPMARALRDLAAAEVRVGKRIQIGSHMRPAPDGIIAFITAFDHGMFPELTEMHGNQYPVWITVS